MKNIFLVFISCLATVCTASAVDHQFFLDTTSAEPVKVVYIRQDGSQFSQWPGTRYWTMDIPTQDTMVTKMFCGSTTKVNNDINLMYIDNEGNTYISHDGLRWRKQTEPVINRKKPTFVAPAYEESFKIFPNPASDIVTLNISLKYDSKVRLSISTLQGRQAAVLLEKELPVGKQSFKIDMSELPPGAYIYTMTINNNISGGVITLVR